MVMPRLSDVNMVGHGNASAILGRVATAMRSISGVMPDFAIDATAGSPDEWTTGGDGDDDSCLIHSACGTLIEMDCPSGPESGAPNRIHSKGAELAMSRLLPSQRELLEHLGTCQTCAPDGWPISPEGRCLAGRRLSEAAQVSQAAARLAEQIAAGHDIGHRSRHLLKRAWRAAREPHRRLRSARRTSTSARRA